jgi:hypothetical protein
MCFPVECQGVSRNRTFIRRSSQFIRLYAPELAGTIATGNGNDSNKILLNLSDPREVAVRKPFSQTAKGEPESVTPSAR